MVSVGAPKTRFPSCKTKPLVQITPMRQTIPRAIGQGLAVALTVCVAAAHGSTPQALEQASAGAAVNDAATAVSRLEAALGATPDDERLYQQLSELYDQKALDYDKALDLYQRYLERFPGGHLAALFRERQLVLLRNREVWPLLVRYRQILQSSFERSGEANVRAVEALLGEAARTPLEPDLLLWLAGALTPSEPDRALGYVDRYLASLPGSGRSPTERAQGLALRVNLLHGQGRNTQALAVLRELKATDPSGWQGLERVLSAKVWATRACWAATAVLALLGLLGLLLRPWREPGFAWQSKKLSVLAVGVVVVTLGPMAVLRLRGVESPGTFAALAGFGVLELVVLKLLAPLAARIGRPAYLGLSLLVVVSGLYLAFFLGGTLGVWEWPFEAWRS
jgi:tetratricopeptide (TPR) repeat protein